MLLKVRWGGRTRVFPPPATRYASGYSVLTYDDEGLNRRVVLRVSLYNGALLPTGLGLFLHQREQIAEISRRRRS